MHHQNPNWNPYIPFATAEEWKTVALATQHRFGKRIVDDWIKGSLWKVESYQSAEHMWELIDSLPDGLGPRSWKSQSLLVVEDGKEVKYPFYYRNPLDCVRLLLRHLPFKQDLVWAPVRQFSNAQHSERLYSDLHTGDCWWTEQEKLPKGATLVPIICGSDKTLLTTMAGSQSAWPVYITIGNIPKLIRKKQSANAVLLLALLPKFPKGNNAASTRAGFHIALTTIFKPLRSVYSTGLDMDCADGFVRFWFPRLAAWMADTPEQSLLTSVIGGFCPACTVPKDNMGEQVEEWPSRVPNNRKKRKESSVEKWNEKKESSLEPPKQQHPQVTFMECLWPELNPYQVVAPDTLHQLQLGLFKHHLIPWTMELLRQNINNPPTHISCRMSDALDRRMSAIPRFQGLHSLPDGRFSTVTQLTGKEYRELTRIFLVAVAPLLIHHPQHLEAIRAGIDFMLLASYQSHSDTTIQFL
jgi:hypothetical protein